MNYLKRFVPALVALSSVGFLAAQPARPPKEPAKLEISVAPDALEAGGLATITVRLHPKDGIKINRYPKIKLEVSETPGLVHEAKVEMGDAKPPPPEKMSTNYYKEVDPVELELRLDAEAPSGSHEVDAKLTYYYCVAASGFCAPARVPIKIPVDVR
jgi:hypothetical protein